MILGKMIYKKHKIVTLITSSWALRANAAGKNLSDPVIVITTSTCTFGNLI